MLYAIVSQSVVGNRFLSVHSIHPAKKRATARVIATRPHIGQLPSVFKIKVGAGVTRVATMPLHTAGETVRHRWMAKMSEGILDVICDLMTPRSDVIDGPVA